MVIQRATEALVEDWCTYNTFIMEMSTIGITLLNKEDVEKEVRNQVEEAQRILECLKQQNLEYTRLL